MGKKLYRPPRGFRDFPPNIMILRKRIFNSLERVFQRYGFDPIDTPVLEYWETLAGKYGDEAESRLIWRFTDPWSGREYALRYDLTVPLARFISNHQDLPLPFKRYHIGPVWRHEEPQKGRYREFYQCDADIVGSPYPESDAEVINLVIDALREIGFSSGYRVRINDRRLLRGVYEEELGLSNPIPVYRVVDKLDKIGLDGVEGELKRLGLESNKINKILKLLSMRGDPQELIRNIEEKYKNNKNISKAINHLSEVIGLVNDRRIIELDMSLVRGLDYYTGPIVEIVLDKPRIGSIAGGGRYDNLIAMFLGRDIPATGISIGIERIIDAGLELGIYNLDKRTVTQVQVIILDRDLYHYAWRVTNFLRSLNINTRIDLSRASDRVQRRKAQRIGVRFLVFIGKREASNETLTIYDTISGKRTEIPLENAERILQIFS